MLFCEKCNALSEDKICPVCGGKKLREAEEDDFCLFAVLEASEAKYFEENLKLKNIPAALIGLGINLKNMTSGKFRIYLPYRCFGVAKEIYGLIFK